MIPEPPCDLKENLKLGVTIRFRLADAHKLGTVLCRLLETFQQMVSLSLGLVIQVAFELHSVAPSSLGANKWRVHSTNGRN